MASPAPTITLFCWILGLSKHAFSIDILNSQTVDHLKNTIVRVKKFVDVDEAELELWKVSAFLNLCQIMFTDFP